MLFIEILLSIHCLLLASSWLISRPWWVKQPSFKLKLARLLLISCVISPLLVHCISLSPTPEKLHYISLDVLQDYANQPILKGVPASLSQRSASEFALSAISYSQLFCLLFTLFIAFRAYQLLSGLAQLRLLLNEAIPYRSSGRLLIKVSHRCHIPFSIYLFNKAYILLPVSLLSSPRNVRIAIAHEGQHHRNGDCLWAYFIEVLRLIFWGNPAVTRWQRVLSELQEFSCDEVLVGQLKISAHDYGHCLFQVVQTVSQRSLPSNREFACTVAMAENNDNEDRTFIIRRISMLSTYPGKASKPLLAGMVFAGFAIVAPICVAYSATGLLISPQAKAVDTSNLNPKLQAIAEKEINAAVNRYHAKSGVIAIADPGTGKIIAFAESAKNSWRSRVFSPASTIKPFIAAAAIDSGHSSAAKSYDCHSPYYVEGKAFTNYDSDLGAATLTEAVAKSINVCLIKVSQETGATVIRKKLTDFGFDLSSWQTKQNQDLQLAEAALGENIPVTVETLTKSYAILANKGRLFDAKAGSAVSAATTESVTSMLESAVQNGTGKLAALPSVAVAGKTGTMVDSQDNRFALFAGYAPAEAPRYVMLVIIENGYLNKDQQTLTSGGDLAAPVFRQVAMNGGLQ
nr:hypothetical protein cemce18_00002 [uncultured bacterium]